MKLTRKQVRELNALPSLAELNSRPHVSSAYYECFGRLMAECEAKGIWIMAVPVFEREVAATGTSTYRHPLNTTPDWPDRDHFGQLVDNSVFVRQVYDLPGDRIEFT